MHERKSNRSRKQQSDRRRAGKAMRDPPHPDPGTEEFAFEVAQFAWQDGLTANIIAKRIGLTSSSKDLMRVKRALKHAQTNFLKLIPPSVIQLQEKLHDRINERERRKRKITFHVVDDRWGPEFTPVAAHAATLASKLIFEAVREADRVMPSPAPVAHGQGKTDEAKVIICNAGGRTIAQMVRALLRTPREYDEEIVELNDETLFLAGNAAYRPKEFDCSANFLSVTMAGFFKAAHLALPKVEDPGFPKDYDALADRASLFICGVGTPESGLMGKYFNDHSWDVPPEAVGDLAFNLLNENGENVELPSDARPVMHELNPALSLSRIAHIAANNRVLLIIDSDKPELKAKIGVAALRREYATDVVLGVRLAEAILAIY